jgi:hypothetical protein
MAGNSSRCPSRVDFFQSRMMPKQRVRGLSCAQLKLQGCLLVWVLSGADIAEARAEDSPSPPVYELNLIGIYEEEKPEYIFAIGGSGFRSVESLKKFLGSRPKGTEVRWAPGCVRMGGEPLLSSEKDMQDFRTFLEQHGIKFTLIPSG